MSRAVVYDAVDVDTVGGDEKECAIWIGQHIFSTKSIRRHLDGCGTQVILGVPVGMVVDSVRAWCYVLDGYHRNASSSERNPIRLRRISMIGAWHILMQFRLIASLAVFPPGILPIIAVYADSDGEVVSMSSEYSSPPLFSASDEPVIVRGLQCDPATGHLWLLEKDMSRSSKDEWLARLKQIIPDHHRNTYKVQIRPLLPLPLDKVPPAEKKLLEKYKSTDMDWTTHPLQLYIPRHPPTKRSHLSLWQSDVVCSPRVRWPLLTVAGLVYVSEAHICNGSLGRGPIAVTNATPIVVPPALASEGAIKMLAGDSSGNLYMLLTSASLLRINRSGNVSEVLICRATEITHLHLYKDKWLVLFSNAGVILFPLSALAHIECSSTPPMVIDEPQHYYVIEWKESIFNGKYKGENICNSAIYEDSLIIQAGRTLCKFNLPKLIAKRYPSVTTAPDENKISRKRRRVNLI